MRLSAKCEPFIKKIKPLSAKSSQKRYYFRYCVILTVAVYVPYDQQSLSVKVTGTVISPIVLSSIPLRSALRVMLSEFN